MTMNTVCRTDSERVRWLEENKVTCFPVERCWPDGEPSATFWQCSNVGLEKARPWFREAIDAAMDSIQIPVQDAEPKIDQAEGQGKIGGRTGSAHLPTGAICTISCEEDAEYFRHKHALEKIAKWPFYSEPVAAADAMQEIAREALVPPLIPGTCIQCGELILEGSGCGCPKAAPCMACGGDGKETCNNPDHSFLDAVGGEDGRLGCPGCGHNKRHKTRDPCPECNGTGIEPKIKTTIMLFTVAFICMCGCSTMKPETLWNHNCPHKHGEGVSNIGPDGFAWWCNCGKSGSNKPL